MLSLSRRPGEAVQITVPASAAGTILRTELLEREGE